MGCIPKAQFPKALNGHAPDISETLRKKHYRNRRCHGIYKSAPRKKPVKKNFAFSSRIFEYEKPHHFGYDFIVGFRQLAEPSGLRCRYCPRCRSGFKSQFPMTFLCSQNNYAGAFALGFALQDPWMKDFKTCKTPTALYDNYIKANPCVTSVGIDNNEGMETGRHPPEKSWSQKNRIFKRRSGFLYYAGSGKKPSLTLCARTVCEPTHLFSVLFLLHH